MGPSTKEHVLTWFPKMGYMFVGNLWRRTWELRLTPFVLGEERLARPLHLSLCRRYLALPYFLLVFFFCSWLWVLASVSATGSKLFFAVFFPRPLHVNIFFAFFLLRSAASAACSSRSGKM